MLQANKKKAAGIDGQVVVATLDGKCVLRMLGGGQCIVFWHVIWSTVACGRLNDIMCQIEIYEARCKMSVLFFMVSDLVTGKRD